MINQPPDPILFIQNFVFPIIFVSRHVSSILDKWDFSNQISFWHKAENVDMNVIKHRYYKLMVYTVFIPSISGKNWYGLLLLY